MDAVDQWLLAELKDSNLLGCLAVGEEEFGLISLVSFEFFFWGFFGGGEGEGGGGWFVLVLMIKRSKGKERERGLMIWLWGIPFLFFVDQKKTEM